MSGVRSSWLIRERNSLLARSARSAWPRASRSAASRGVRSVMSVEIPPTAYGRPCSSRNGNLIDSHRPSMTSVSGSSTSSGRPDVSTVWSLAA